MLIVKLAYRNLKGAGLRTWLNVASLAFTYVLIIWHQGLFTGMLQKGSQAMIDDDVAGGQYWHENYNPFDPLSYDDAHGTIPEQFQKLIREKKAAPVLIRQAAIYPEGRMQTALLRGIDPSQEVLALSFKELAVQEDGLPIVIGKRMAKSLKLKTGDSLIVRWRDVHGTFDAEEGTIVAIMKTNVPTIDKGQLWVPLKTLQRMTGMTNEATIITVSENAQKSGNITRWVFKDQAFLLRDITAVVKSKRIGSLIMYSILLFLGLLAVFDTQILSIFKRRKEIGTLMALGMTRLQVIVLFTLEGALHGIIALGVALVAGTPLLYITAKYGIPLPEVTEQYGFAIQDKLVPVYTVGLVLITVCIVMMTVTIVSFLPTHTIAKLKPTEALKGKLS